MIISEHQNYLRFWGKQRGAIDGGANWSSLSRGLPVRTYDAVALDSAAGRLYAGADGGGIFELRLRR